MTPAYFRIDIPSEFREMVETAGFDHDLSATSVVVAILDAAFRTRVAGGLILNSLAQNRVKAKRRPIRQVWESVGKHGYMLGEYTLTRQGNGGHYARDTDGWYIEGPEINRTFVGNTVREAHQTATAMVGRVQPDLIHA